MQLKHPFNRKFLSFVYIGNKTTTGDHTRIAAVHKRNPLRNNGELPLQIPEGCFNTP